MDRWLGGAFSGVMISDVEMSSRPARRAVELYLTTAQAAFALQFSPKWVRARVKDGSFPGAVDVDGDIRIPASAVNRFLDDHQVKYEVPISAAGIGELRRKMLEVES